MPVISNLPQFEPFLSENLHISGANSDGLKTANFTHFSITDYLRFSPYASIHFAPIACLIVHRVCTGLVKHVVTPLTSGYL